MNAAEKTTSRLQYPDALAPAGAKRIGCVSYLNAKPLIEPILARRDVEVAFAVPAELLPLLNAGTVAAGLLPIVDYQTSPAELVLVPAGVISSDGPTLTVRIFSRVPPEQITRLHADTDSHTSVILAQLILRRRYRQWPQIVPLKGYRGLARPGRQPKNPPIAQINTDVDPDPSGRAGLNSGHDQQKNKGLASGQHKQQLTVTGTGADAPVALLLIGDKVVNAAPDQAVYHWQLDLGEQWKQLTRLPFVFAMWMMRAAAPDVELGRLLAEARRQGQQMVEPLVARYAPACRWPTDLARRYFTEYLQYEVTPQCRSAVEIFFRLADEEGLLPLRRPVQYLELA